jgi:phage terminase large subunit-like protein
MDAVARVNPAPWITAADLRRQRAAVQDGAFAQFHACRWGVGEGSWLPAGAWQSCVGDPEFTDGEPVWVGCDVGGQRSCTALVWVNERLHVGCRIYTGDEAILEVADHVRALGRQYTIREFVFDPWRAGQLAAELEREGVTCVQFNQNDQRMVPASERLYSAIVERRLTLPDDRELARHSANATAKHSRRGWRISKPDDRTHIDGIVALAMAVERAAFRPEPVELLGWL